MLTVKGPFGEGTKCSGRIPRVTLQFGINLPSFPEFMDKSGKVHAIHFLLKLLFERHVKTRKCSYAAHAVR